MNLRELVAQNIIDHRKRIGALDQMAQMDAFEEFEGERKAAKMAARTICRAQR